MRVKQRFHRPARNLYQRLLNREHFEERRRRREHFRPFVRRGDLVFDVGANRGHYAETFRELGARVVAIEPNPSAAGAITRHFPGIRVVQKAVGAGPGTAALRLGRDDQHSTLSDEWAETYPERWQDMVEVELTTLDELIGVFGRPAFAKIDVEGYEAEVLRGLTLPIAALTFEFQAARPDDEPFRLLEALGSYNFAVSTGPFTLSEWGTAAEARGRIARFSEDEPQGSGDVFARLRLGGRS